MPAKTDVDRYIEKHRRIDDFEALSRVDEYLGYLTRFGPQIDGSSKLLEVGIGPGWFPIMCAKRGIRCVGLEISEKIAEFAKETARREGVEIEVIVANVEDEDVGENKFDGIIASNVFEHIRHWKAALERLYRALKPGAALYWESSNKFSPISGEHKLPFYSWLPDQARYAFRRAVQGPDIMELGIDFHQFRHGQLRREFERVGFSRIYDRLQLAREDRISSGFRRRIVQAARKSSVARAAALTFADATRFICIK